MFLARRTLPLAAALVAACIALVAVPGAAARARSAVTGKYLLSFLACDRATLGDACNDPRNHHVYLAQSDDGVSWSVLPGWRPYAGSVPDVIRRGDTIYLYTPGQLARYHVSTGVLDPPLQVAVTGLGQASFVDPSAIQESDGRLVLFFLPGRFGSDPASCLSISDPCVQHFQSATEVAGSDGARFTLDAGDRAAVTLASGSSTQSASDPDVFAAGSTYVLYVSEGQSTVALTSNALHGSFAQASTLVPQGAGGVASGYYDPPTQRYWTYAHIGGGSSPTVIRRAVGADLTTPLPDAAWTTVLTGATAGLGAGYDVASPGFAPDTTGIPLAASATTPTSKPAAKKAARKAKKTRPLCKKHQRSTTKKPCRKR